MARKPTEPGSVAKAVILNKEENRACFDAVMALLQAGADLIDATGREALKGGRMLITAQATRALNSFETVIAACLIGRGVQAAMLDRALYDDVLDIHWVAENPKDALDRADEHDRMIALAEHQLEAKHERTDRPLTEEEENELAELIDVYGGKDHAFEKPWHRASFKECFALVQKRWSDDPDAEKYLDYMYEVEQRRNNLMLHPSPTAFRQTIRFGRGAVARSPRPGAAGSALSGTRGTLGRPGTAALHGKQ